MAPRQHRGGVTEWFVVQVSAVSKRTFSKGFPQINFRRRQFFFDRACAGELAGRQFLACCQIEIKQSVTHVVGEELVPLWRARAPVAIRGIGVVSLCDVSDVAQARRCKCEWEWRCATCGER